MLYLLFHLKFGIQVTKIIQIKIVELKKNIVFMTSVFWTHLAIDIHQKCIMWGIILTRRNIEDQ